MDGLQVKGLVSAGTGPRASESVGEALFTPVPPDSSLFQSYEQAFERH